jgi:hypothetical protein
MENAMHQEAFDFNSIDLLHERLCLDFINSSPFHFTLSEDHSYGYADLVSWSLHVELINDDQGQRLLALAEERPAKAAVVFQKAIALRETIYAILAAIAHSQTPKADELLVF